MILVDANVLLYAYNAGAPQHDKARAWLEAAFNGSEQVGLPWSSILAFLRIATHSSVFSSPLTGREARAIVCTWLDCPQVLLVGPGTGHWEHLERALETGKCQGSLVMDAHLAALTWEYGARLYTSDRDFSRFPGLRVSDPVGP